MNIQRTVIVGLGGLAGLILGAATGMAARFYLGRRLADQVWTSSRYPRLADVGTVKQLSVIPLIDWYTAYALAAGDGAGSPHIGQQLTGEPGVSYLIRADDTTLLFDMGLNPQVTHPSPLLRNMEALGLSIGNIDAVVISHAHLDHVGGASHARQHTFAPSAGPVNLNGVPAYVPEPLSNPTTQTIVVDGPQRIAPGVVSLGPIPRQLFFDGWRPEQSLAVNVARKGLVLIIGCGHSTVQRIVARAEMLFDEPLYGLIGGLHFPVTASRSIKFGLPAQRIFGTGKWPWDPINQNDVTEAIDFLKRRRPELVSLSPHDSCDWTLDAFRHAFGDAYQELLVGKPITV